MPADSHVVASRGDRHDLELAIGHAPSIGARISATAIPELRNFKSRLDQIIRCAAANSLFASKEIDTERQQADSYQPKRHQNSQSRHDILQTRKPISLVYTKDEAEGWMAGADSRDVSPLELQPAYP